MKVDSGIPLASLGLSTNMAESCFDPSTDSFSYTNFQAVNIAKWREDISGPAIAGQELFPFSTDLRDMNGSDAFELKDTTSEYSMDSAYQSQSGASRRGAAMSESYQTFTQDARRGNQFMGNDIYSSPSLSSDNFSAFPEHPTDMSRMHLPSAAADMESAEGSYPFANYSTGQDYTQYSTSVPRFTPTSAIDMGLHWPTADAYNTFSFAPFPKSSPSIDATLYASQDSSMLFNTPATNQRHMTKPRLDTSVRPSSVRSSSSFAMKEESRREAGFGPFVMSPSSAVSSQMPHASGYELPQQMDSRHDSDEVRSASHVTHSVHDEDEILSASDAAEAKTMDEEQGKVARNHPLYQATPDENGKYHCPNEGQAGCNHKPTPLKCNYDKYVDSHLKPFRCTRKACFGVQFSSTACLLRHEREAHGMHAHGIRPHLCHYPDCERSVMGNGFPRRYNLFDHMKRVHDFTGPATEPSPPSGHGQASRKATSRKRKSAGDEPVEKRQKVVKSPQQQLQEKRDKLEQTFLSKKQAIIDILAKLNGPSDLRDDIQLTKEVVLLQDLSNEYRKNIGG
ncbi:hypothetical protein BS50DRAFT_588890 [Corynespora cassiicola Philippines]|uniref:C2H2-type domain-containing protein n=1 Tax=Corynespora cassiicola Philippines TaxID=1448308 RepID=A0A2T2NL13_CORCC|nr:hypothetical protein BS50DRAFT_588890 [Corynespora cassiicola Philippines]